MVIASPGDEETIFGESEIVIAAGGNGDDVGQSGRHIGLVVAIPTPGEQGAIAAKHQIVMIAGGDSDDIG